MQQVEIQKEMLIQFIKLNNSFYLFTDLDGHSIEQLEKIKKMIESDIRTEAQKKKINLRNIYLN